VWLNGAKAVGVNGQQKMLWKKLAMTDLGARVLNMNLIKFVTLLNIKSKY
jgi:hypothetical protein